MVFGCVAVGVALVRREYRARAMDCMSSWLQTTVLLLFLVRGRIQFESAHLPSPPSPNLFPMHRVISAALLGTWTEFRHTDCAQRMLCHREVKLLPL